MITKIYIYRNMQNLYKQTLFNIFNIQKQKNQLQNRGAKIEEMLI